MNIDEIDSRDTGRFLKLCADDEHAAEDVISIECRDGKYIVGGVVMCLTLEEAQGLAA